MRDWDKTIDELRNNIQEARKKFVFPYLDPTQFETNTSLNKSKVNVEEKNVSTDKVSDIEKQKTEDANSVSSKDIREEEAEKVQKVDTAQVDAMSDEMKSEVVPVEEAKEDEAEKVQKVDTAQVDAMLDEVKSEDVPVEEAKEEEVKNAQDEKKTPIVKEKTPSQKPKKRKKKVKEVKPDYVLIELAELEAINEDDLSEEQEERLMELRRIKTQRAMHEEVDEQFQSEMKQADEEIKILKSQLKIKDPLPKGYVE